MIQTYIGNRQPNVFTADLDGPGAFAFGRANDDILNGSNAADFLFGGRGADALYGKASDDQLSGGRGDDYLYGGAGDDLLNGGKGRDYFVFRLDDEGVDLVKDFKPGRDTLSFLTGSPDNTPHLSYDAGTGFVYNDGHPVVWIGHHPGFDI